MMFKYLSFTTLILAISLAPVFAEGGEAGVEQALVTYTDAKAGFSIGHPGTWTRDASFLSGVRFEGGDDAMEVRIVSQEGITSIQAFATKDTAELVKAFPGYHQISLKQSKDIKGAWILEFSAQGNSAVTGKAFTAHNERYYIPLPGNRVGLVTVTGPDNHYDLEGVRDIALTLVVRK